MSADKASRRSAAARAIYWSAPIAALAILVVSLIIVAGGGSLRRTLLGAGVAVALCGPLVLWAGLRVMHEERHWRARVKTTPLHTLPVDERVREGFRRHVVRRSEQLSAALFVAVWIVAFAVLMIRNSGQAPQGASFGSVAAVLRVAGVAALWASVFAFDAWVWGGWLTRPIGWLWARRDRARGRIAIPGACPRCFYDLSGLAGDVCPECGGRSRRRRRLGPEPRD